jgi:endonuclease G
MQVIYVNTHNNKSIHLSGKLLWAIAGIAISFGIAITAAIAGDNNFEQCRQLFAHGNPPVIQHPEDLRPRALCFSAFAVLHSGNSRTPIYVAERLNRKRYNNTHVWRH